MTPPFREIRPCIKPGAVQLLAHDAERHAMLLEALGPSMTKLDMAPEAQLETLCRLLRPVWEVPHAVTGRYASAVDKASGLHQLVGRYSTDRDRPCSEQVLAQARIAAHLRDAILSGEIDPGERIRQEEVAERLGTSRLPVREALRILEAEGLTERTANKGARVPRWTPPSSTSSTRCASASSRSP